MINKMPGLHLKLTKSLNNLNLENGPYTPLEQTLKTPIDPPNGNFNGFFPQPPGVGNGSIYSNPQNNESDDILTDFEESGFKGTKSYKLNFTPNFDQLILSIYSHILALPTTTPFSGLIPPSGLVSKVANETMHHLIVSTSNSNHPLYDQQSIINNEYLKNYKSHPIFLSLIRKRLLELCSYNNGSSSVKLPLSTSISVTISSSGNSALRKSSISNLSLAESNISNLSQNNRSRSSSISLRKQSLTRNNSYSGSNWLHIGNLNNSRSHNMNEGMNSSTDSLQSMQDFVPQALISRSANSNSNNNSNSNGSLNTPVLTNNGFNSMMMDYNTPPNSNKSSISSSSITPPQNVQLIHNASGSDLDDFNFYGQLQRQRSHSSSRNNSFPNPLTINTDSANIQAFNSLNNSNYNGQTLDSPFMSATTPSEEYGFFPNNFQSGTYTPENSVQENTIPIDSKLTLQNQFALSEKKRDSLKLKRGIH